MNTVVLSGTLAREPKLDLNKTEPETRLLLNTTRIMYTDSGSWKAVETKIPVLFVGDKAERVAGWHKEGAAVEIEGELQGYELRAGKQPIFACVVIGKRIGSVKSK